MKHGGPYQTTDCVRKVKAIADAQGRVLYIAPAEDEKRPGCAGITTGPKAEQNVHPYCSKGRSKSQCRK